MGQIQEIFQQESTELLTQNTSLQFWKEYAEEQRENFYADLEGFDQQALSALSSANGIIDDIVSIGSPTGLGTACYETSTSWVSSTYGSLLDHVGTAVGTVLGIATTSLIGYGAINYDKLEAYIYPKVEKGSLDVSDDNPIDGAGWATLNSSNKGSGSENRYQAGAGSTAGYVFAIKSGCRGTIESQVSSKKSTYNGHVSDISDANSLANSSKGKKSSYEFQVWSYSRKVQSNTDIVSDNNSAVGILSAAGGYWGLTFHPPCPIIWG